MRVTKLEPVSKIKFKVFIDEQFAFILYKGELSRFKIKEGEIIPEETYEIILSEVIARRARLRAMYLLENMGRTESQLRDKLKKDGYTEDITESAITYVKSFGYVNDKNYAINYIESRKEKKSKKELYMTLVQKGIAPEIIDEALDACLDSETELEALIRLMEKRHFDPECTDPKEYKRQMSYFYRKGYSYGRIQKAAERLSGNA